MQAFLLPLPLLVIVIFLQDLNHLSAIFPTPTTTSILTACVAIVLTAVIWMTFEFCAFASARWISIVGFSSVRPSTSPAIATRISIWCDEFIMRTKAQPAADEGRSMPRDLGIAYYWSLNRGKLNSIKITTSRISVFLSNDLELKTLQLKRIHFKI